MNHIQTPTAHIDIIGDVHGCLNPLQRLLERLGYVDSAFGYVHPEGRQAIFVGDLLDRGVDVRGTVELVKTMCLNGSAQMVLGNHEYNAIARADLCRRWLCGETEGTLNDRQQRLMRTTLHPFVDDVAGWDELIGWLKTLPLFIDNPQYRVVHACWDQNLIDHFRQSYGLSAGESGYLCESFYEHAVHADSFEARLVDRLTRGINMALPSGVSLQGSDGFVRRFFRSKFWANEPKTYGDVVFQPDPLPYDLHEQPLQQKHQDDLVFYGIDEVPVFFGHYWLSGRPEPLRRNIACLDYSAVNFGRLTAYRFDGETSLSADKFVWVYHEQGLADEADTYEQDDNDRSMNS